MVLEETVLDQVVDSDDKPTEISTPESINEEGMGFNLDNIKIEFNVLNENLLINEVSYINKYSLLFYIY